MNHDHVADRAELYALGALDPGENATIETHLRQCSSCARIVGSAERDVALIASRETRRNAPPELAGRIERTLEVNQSEPLRTGRYAWRLPAALAAALLIGLLPSAYFWSEYRTLHGAMLAQNAAMERLASAAHRTATFQAAHGTSRAEVIYGTDGSWYLVVVRDPSRTLAVAWMHDGEHTMLGSAIPSAVISRCFTFRRAIAWIDSRSWMAIGSLLRRLFRGKERFQIVKALDPCSRRQRRENRRAVTRRGGTAVEQRDETAVAAAADESPETLLEAHGGRRNHVVLETVETARLERAYASHDERIARGRKR